VRGKTGEGTRQMWLAKNWKKTEILAFYQQLFFYDGKIMQGSINDFKFEMMDFQYRPFA
jgi:hypothetical protein